MTPERRKALWLLRRSRIRRSAFLPTDINGLVLWLRADLGVESAAGVPAVDTDPVQFWRDQSGGGNDGTQATATNRPAFDASEPELDFDGVDNWLSNSSAASVWTPAHETALSIFVVCKFSGGSSTQHIIDTANNNANQHGFNLNVNATNGNVAAAVFNGSGTRVVTASLTAGMTLGQLHIVEFSWSVAAGFSLRTDGGTPVTGSTVGTPSSTDPSGSPRLGSIVAGSVQFLNGSIREVVAYPGKVLVGSEFARVRQYLSARHNVPLA